MAGKGLHGSQMMFQIISILMEPRRGVTIETLEQLSAADVPFYVAIGFVKPHLPFAAPTKYWGFI